MLHHKRVFITQRECNNIAGHDGATALGILVSTLRFLLAHADAPWNVKCIIHELYYYCYLLLSVVPVMWMWYSSLKILLQTGTLNLTWVVGIPGRFMSRSPIKCGNSQSWKTQERKSFTAATPPYAFSQRDLQLLQGIGYRPRSNVSSRAL